MLGKEEVKRLKYKILTEHLRADLGCAISKFACTRVKECQINSLLSKNYMIGNILGTFQAHKHVAEKDLMTNYLSKLPYPQKSLRLI